jgi:hypothetical protein
MASRYASLLGTNSFRYNGYCYGNREIYLNHGRANQTLLELYPLIQSEIQEFNLLKALNNGLLPLKKAIFVNKRWKTLMNI